MAMSSAELLTQLELVMTEFFTGNTSNERKREIEAQLNNVWLQPEAWKHCLYCIRHTNNQYVAMPCITALENLINRQVASNLSAGQLAEVRQTLQVVLSEKHASLEYFVRNKLVKVVVDIARIQWPHDYPNFIEDIMMIGEHGSVVLCLVFLQLTTEELAIREHQLMPHERKLQIRSHLHSHAPHMLAYVSGVLEKLLLLPGERGGGGAGGGASGTTTPPPSPSHSPHSPAASPQPSSPASASQMSSVLQLLEQHSHGHYLPSPRWLVHATTTPPSWDAHADNQAYVALNCLAQLMAWLPLELLAADNNKLIDIVFTFAALGGVQSGGSQSSNTVSISAVSCIQEFLARSCIPPALNPLLLHVLRSCSVLVHHLLSVTSSDQLAGGGNAGPSSTTAKQRLATLHPTYLDKVTELVRVLVAVYFRRFEHHPQFNVGEFLSLLFRYSFSQPCLDGYLDCLDIWSTLLEHLWAKGGGQGADGGGAFPSHPEYESVLKLLMKGVLHKIQLRHNKSELEELDYDMLEEAGGDSSCQPASSGYSDAWEEHQGGGGLGGGGVEHLAEQSECQSFFSHNLDLLARLADIMPDEIMDMVVPEWQANCAVYLGLENTLRLERVTEPGGHTSLRLSNSQLSEEVLLVVHCALRDLCTLLQLLGRLATTFLGPQLVARADTAMETLHRLVELGDFGMRLQLYSLDTSIDLLRTDLIQIHCEVLCSLRAWSHWLSQLYGHQFVVTKASTASSSSVESSSDSGPLQHTPSPTGGCGAVDEGSSSSSTSSNSSSGGVVSTHPHLSTCHGLTRQLLVLAASAVSSNDTGGAPWVVVRCGVQLLLTVSVLVVSPVALEVMQVQHLYSAPVYSDNTPPGKVREMLYRALVNFLLLPYPTYSVQQQPAQQQQQQQLGRQRMLMTFMATITAPLTAYDVDLQRRDPAIREKTSSGLKECLCLVRSQLCQLSGADRASRELYWSCVRIPLNNTMVNLLPLHCNTPGVLLEIVGTVMWSIGVVGGGCATPRTDSGMSPISEVCGWIERLVQLVTHKQYLTLALANDQSPQAAVLARFLHLLSLVLSDPSPAFKRLVGAVVATLDEIYPLVSLQPTAAIRQPLFAVLRTLLEHNWKYFYRSSIQQPLSQSAWEDVQHGEQLSRILQAFGQSFMQTDIAVFRQNLTTLQLLNTKFRLYSKSVFRPLLTQFITVLLQVLLHGSHALLQDEIITSVYHMASVDLAAFHSHFLDTFLRNTLALTDQQRHALRTEFSTDTDLPTFSQSIQRLINDLRYYRSVNGAQEL